MKMTNLQKGSILQGNKLLFLFKKCGIDHFIFSMFQFWVLLKRALLCIMRDQMLTQLRFISHILIGVAIGLLYDDIGGNAKYSTQNISLFFLVILFLVRFS